MAIDPKTGAKRVSQELVPGDGQTKLVCPHVSGGRGWLPTVYDAATKIVYIPITEACMDLVPVPAGERGALSTGVRWTVKPRPASDGKYGRIHALNLETGKTVWVDRSGRRSRLERRSPPADSFSPGRSIAPSARTMPPPAQRCGRLA